MKKMEQMEIWQQFMIGNIHAHTLFTTVCMLYALQDVQQVIHPHTLSCET